LALLQLPSPFFATTPAFFDSLQQDLAGLPQRLTVRTHIAWGIEAQYE
jgi:hypothetical protein